MVSFHSQGSRSRDIAKHGIKSRGTRNYAEDSNNLPDRSTVTMTSRDEVYHLLGCDELSSGKSRSSLTLRRNVLLDVEDGGSTFFPREHLPYDTTLHPCRRYHGSLVIVLKYAKQSMSSYVNVVPSYHKCQLKLIRLLLTNRATYPCAQTATI
jgi:hypothetical protein